MGGRGGDGGEGERKVSQFQGLNRTQHDIRGSKVACLTMS